MRGHKCGWVVSSGKLDWSLTSGNYTGLVNGCSNWICSGFVCLSHVFFTTGNKVRRDKNWINFSSRINSSRRLRVICGGWSDRISWFLASFHRWCICGFRGRSFSISCSGLCSSVCGANISIVGCEVVKTFATCTTSVSVFSNVFIVCLEMVIKGWLVSKPFLTTRARLKCLPSVNTSMSI